METVTGYMKRLITDLFELKKEKEKKGTRSLYNKHGDGSNLM